MNVFITGGAGFIGTSLIPLLLKSGFNVTVYDSLLFNNGDKLLPYVSHPNFKFIKGDVRDKMKLSKYIKNHAVVIHLAALVGYPLCDSFGEATTHDVNVEGTLNVINLLDPEQYLLFSSTTSNYGHATEVCTEESILNPLTGYGRSKTRAEALVANRPNSTIFRFTTAFGVSGRLRLDLLLNDLTHKSIKDGYVVIYEKDFVRSFIHVKDIAYSFLFAIHHHNDMVNNVYNIGCNEMNYTKEEICNIIQSKIPNSYFNYSDILKDQDQRNYKISFDKISKLGFKATKTIEDGINDIKVAIELINQKSPYHNVI